MQNGVPDLTRILVGIGVALFLFVAGSLAVRGLRQVPRDPHWPVPGGDPLRGRRAVVRHGCGSCHVIDGLSSATGRVGPKLNDFREQAYIAGQLPNVPHHLVRWIRNAQEVEPGTAMPDLPVTEAEARDIAAYLYSDPPASMPILGTWWGGGPERPRYAPVEEGPTPTTVPR